MVLDRVRRAAQEQVAQARRDAERDQAKLRAGLEARIAAAEEARAGLQARAEQAEADTWQARLAARQAEARLTETRAAKAAAEQEARAAQGQVAAARQERDEAVACAKSRGGRGRVRGRAGRAGTRPSRPAPDDAEAGLQRPSADRDEAAGAARPTTTQEHDTPQPATKEKVSGAAGCTAAP